MRQEVRGKERRKQKGLCETVLRFRIRHNLRPLARPAKTHLLPVPNPGAPHGKPGKPPRCALFRARGPPPAPRTAPNSKPDQEPVSWQNNSSNLECGAFASIVATQTFNTSPS